MQMFEEERYIRYSEREDWKDVQPITQDDGPAPVAPIAYSSWFTDTMRYFRAILEKNEVSQRAYELTSDVIRMNPSNYAVWMFRLELVDALGVDFEKEYAFLDSILEDTQKCYQYWNYRGKLLTRSKMLDREFKFINEAIDMESKNYHAFCHKQWIVRTFDSWNGELEWTEKLIKLDVWNNSAWNHRYFVIKHGPSKIGDDSDSADVLRREVDFTLEYIRKSPSNESPWLYMKGLMAFMSDSHLIELQKTAEDLQKRYPYSHTPDVFLADVYEKTGDYEKERELIRTKLLKNGIQCMYWRYRLDHMPI